MSESRSSSRLDDEFKCIIGIHIVSPDETRQINVKSVARGVIGTDGCSPLVSNRENKIRGSFRKK